MLKIDHKPKIQKSNSAAMNTFLFVLGPHLIVLRTYCWLCTKDSLLTGLEVLYGVVGI